MELYLNVSFIDIAYMEYCPVSFFLEKGRQIVNIMLWFSEDWLTSNVAYWTII